MLSARSLVALVLSVAVFGAVDAAWHDDLVKFRAEREKDISGVDGWTSLVGLHWLHEGPNKIGSSTDADIPMPASFPKQGGVITFVKGAVEFKPATGVALTMNGKPARGGAVKENTDLFTLGSVKFMLIRRGDQAAIRVRDNDSEARKKFTHLSWFDPDPSWRVEARWEAAAVPRTLFFDTVVPGLREEMKAPGVAVFSRGGHEYRLEPVLEDNELFYIFRDQTAGKTTYAAARYMYSDMPKNGKVVLDFNKATNPPCAFTSFATCPLPPPQNRLTLAIPAGEKMYAGPTY